MIRPSKPMIALLPAISHSIIPGNRFNRLKPGASRNLMITR